MVLLRSAFNKSWPPITDIKMQDDGRLIGSDVLLQEDIYFDYVRPFTPVKDRVIVSKRCSTRYYAGNRVELNAAYLKNFERRRKTETSDGDESDIVEYINIPFSIGDVANSLLRCFSDPVEALEALRHTRSAWDEYMSKIPSSSARLEACLSLFLMVAHDVNKSWSFLFNGNGEVGDVVQFHASTDPTAINGPVVFPTAGGRMYSYSRGLSRGVFPNTQLGWWVIVYLQMIKDFSNQNHMAVAKAIIMKLLEFGADISPFFEPLTCHPPDQDSPLTLLATISGGYDANFYQLGGKSMHEVMREYFFLFRERDRSSCTFYELGSLLEILARKSNIKLRFVVGEWVECYMGHELGWKGGLVKELWSGGYSYAVGLEETIAQAPADTDEYIRRPSLRFDVGDRVECNVEGSGWMPGTVTRLWSDIIKGSPYEIVLDVQEDSEFLTAPADWDHCIRALNLNE